MNQRSYRLLLIAVIFFVCRQLHASCEDEARPLTREGRAFVGLVSAAVLNGEMTLEGVLELSRRSEVDYQSAQ